jgi:predicted ABC-type ATPase
MINLIKGKERKIMLPNGEQHKSYYALTDLSNIKASHNEETFSSTIGFPVNELGENINDRNYKEDKSAQNSVIKIAENLNPENLIALTSTPSGSPIIDKNGIVVSGNNRTMSLKLALKKHPNKYQEYKNQLEEDIDSFGFNKNDINNFDNPVLVRLDESLPEKLTTEDLAKFNQDTKKGERPVDKAIKLSNILLANNRCKNAILSIVDGYDTFADLYSPSGKQDRKKLIENLVSCGLLTENQLPTYFDNGDFTEVGKDYIETLLSSIILSPDALRVSNSEGVKRLRQIIISSLPLLVTNESLSEGSLKKYISEAIIIQYKIVQIGDFSDYIRNQTLFEEDVFDKKSLYINALLRQGRNEFKNAIRKYNDSAKSNEGESLFMSEKLDLNQIFKLTIENAVDEKDRKLIQSINLKKPQDTINMVQNNISEVETEEILYEPVELIDTNNTSLFFADNWFKQHPDKVLGVAYESSGKFGKVTKYSGTIELLSKIEVSEDFIGATKSINDPLASVSSDINISAELLQPDINTFVKEVIEKSYEEVKTKKKSQKVEVNEDATVTPIQELNDFKETFKNINTEISLEQVEIYTWYKTSIGKPLSRNYISLFKDDYFTDEELKNMRATHPYKVGDNVVYDWVKRGLLFYYKGNLLPEFEYKSGNMYDKKRDLEQEKDIIVATYGEEVYKNQEVLLQDAFKEVYNKRLTIGGANSLVVLANSKLANEFKISRIEDYPEEKKWKIKKIGTAKDFGKPDIIKDLEIYSDYKREEFDEISLSDAFGWWLLNKKPLLKEPISHLDIYKYYVLGKLITIAAVNDSPEAKKSAAAKREKLKSSTQKDGERLFAEFLSTQLLPNDKIRLETQWNMGYNNYLPINLNKIPVAFTMAKKVGGVIEKVRQEKRDAVAFTMNNGTGILSYDVGVGKTPSAIFTISAFMDAGYCKRPLITVPNQVYKQFIGDFKMFAPHIPILEAYNLSKDFVENFQDVKGEVEKVQEGTVTIMTYEGLERLGFTDETSDKLIKTLYDILNQGGESDKKQSAKAIATFESRIEELVGKGLKGGIYPIEDFGFDFMCYDEAHAMKKVFTSVKGEVEEDEKGNATRGKNPYAINSGSPSSRALKGFMLNYYILQNNNYKNILLLTATPFTNSPLEIFSMLSMVAYETLAKSDLDNLKTFFDNYVKTSTELVINTKLKPQFKQVITGFNNLISLQSLIRRFILYKTGEEVGVIRPKKYVLPYLKEIENGVVVDVPEERKVETYIPMTPQQKAMMEDIISYVESGGDLSNIDYSDSDVNEDIEKDEDETVDKTSGVEVDEDDLSETEKQGVRTIKGLSYSRNLALSPYLYEYSGLGKPDYKTYIEKSPKLFYVMKCIKSVRDYCISHEEKVAGQVIYMDRGIEYFPLIKEYLVKECGYEDNEIGIIKSGLPKTGLKSKEYIKNLFNGEIYNEKTKSFENVDDFRRIKVVIGSSTIKEGMNLQKYGAVLYNCFIDWNPTDIQQLEGRIYRQKNTYDSVRIVNPLVVDSADIFLFQKLQEKTARLNTIWSTDGHSNVLNTEEFNPEELKYALIKNPLVIAELRIIEQKAKLESEILGLNRQIELTQNVQSAADTIKRYNQQIIDSLKQYRTVDLSNDALADASKLVALAIDAEKTRTDKEGKKILASWERRELTNRIQGIKYKMQNYGGDEKQLKELEKLESELSNSSPDLYYAYSKPWFFSDYSVAVRDLKRLSTDFIKQYNISFDLLHAEESLKSFKQEVNFNIEKIKENIEKLNSDENKKILVEEAIEEKERQKVNYKNIPELVADFSKLNFLLNKKKIVESPKKVNTSCPPMEADGKTFATDEISLKYLQDCLDKQQQTKYLYWSEEKGYIQNRKNLHNQIINQLFDNVKCVKSNEQPIAIFTGGSPASGKSSFIEKNAKYLKNKNIFHLDADEIRAKLPEYQGWNANSTHLETQDILNKLLDKIGGFDCQYDFIYDGTMNKSKKYFPLIKKAKDLGYKTYIIFMEIPYAEAKERIIHRYKTKGRFVPNEVIDDFFTKIGDKTKGQAALDELKPYVDGYIVVDGLTGNVIERVGEGIPVDRNSNIYTKRLLENPSKDRTQISEEIEVIQPNTNEDFNEAIFEQVDPNHNWIGNMFREREVKNQLNKLVKGASRDEIENIFLEYKDWYEKKNGLISKPLEDVPVQDSQSKIDIEKLINTLKIALKFSNAENRILIEKQIKALNLSIKYK